MPRYKVIGAREVLGHEPGDEFYADIDPVMEARLVVGGHIARVSEDSGASKGRGRGERRDDAPLEHDESDEKTDDADGDAEA